VLLGSPDVFVALACGNGGASSFVAEAPTTQKLVLSARLKTRLVGKDFVKTTANLLITLPVVASPKRRLAHCSRRFDNVKTA